MPIHTSHRNSAAFMLRPAAPAEASARITALPMTALARAETPGGLAADRAGGLANVTSRISDSACVTFLLQDGTRDCLPVAQ